MKKEQQYLVFAMDASEAGLSLKCLILVEQVRSGEKHLTVTESISAQKSSSL